jgi:integrase
MKANLTDTRIKGCKPKEKPYRLFDGGGLYLEVHPNKSRYWRLKYRFAGKERVYAIGSYPVTTLAAARDEADAARKLVKAGIDPVAHRKTQAIETQEAAVNTFERLAREWIDHQGGRWTKGHSSDVLKSLENDVFPAIGHRPITDIKPPEILAVIRSIERRGVVETARKILQRCASVFRYAIQIGRCTYNPAGEMKGALKTKQVEHRAALTESDLPEFLRALDNYNGDMQTINALKLLMLTIVRTGELRGAKWSEIDFDNATWRIPAERMKMKTEHLVPLSNQAVAVLREQHKLTGQYNLVFPNRSNVMKPMSENTIIYAIYRMGYRSRATGHGFRATASTILNEQGWKADVIERQLAHVERNKVRAAYHRSEYLADRKKMMQSWADYLDGLKQGTNVIAGGFGKNRNI